MRLLEHEAKKAMEKYGIPVPKGFVAKSPEEARDAAEKLGGKAVLKAQIPTGRRGKAGGVKLVSSADEAFLTAREMLSSEFYGLRPRSLLVEQFVDVKREYYIGGIVDRTARGFTFISSAHGGMDVEEMALRYPESVIRVPINPLIGMMPYQARTLAKNIDREREKEIAEIALKLWRITVDYDAFMLEINPLALSSDGKLIALDARIEVDDNALFRHPEFSEEEEGREGEAARKGLSYVELDGDIGTMANGAGLAMATMDLVHLMGGRPANFCDIGGGASSEMVYAGLEMISSNPKVKAIVVNTLCGITDGVEVAKGIKRFVEGRAKVPLFVRLSGNRSKEGSEILEKIGVKTYKSAEDAIKAAIFHSSH
ncbi:MAG: ADP-forming succinate--CoA ligase subunit beta [Candidatus Methanodesulfokora sp.]|jgi:succinyl-CoA synthetase beta subunit